MQLRPPGGIARDTVSGMGFGVTDLGSDVGWQWPNAMVCTAHD